jgi:hypothetical protein
MTGFSTIPLAGGAFAGDGGSMFADRGWGTLRRTFRGVWRDRSELYETDMPAAFEMPVYNPDTPAYDALDPQRRSVVDRLALTIGATLE